MIPDNGKKCAIVFNSFGIFYKFTFFYFFTEDEKPQRQVEQAEGGEESKDERQLTVQLELEKNEKSTFDQLKDYLTKYLGMESTFR